MTDPTLSPRQNGFLATYYEEKRIGRAVAKHAVTLQQLAHWRREPAFAAALAEADEAVRDYLRRHAIDMAQTGSVVIEQTEKEDNKTLKHSERQDGATLLNALRLERAIRASDEAAQSGTHDDSDLADDDLATLTAHLRCHLPDDAAPANEGAPVNDGAADAGNGG